MTKFDLLSAGDQPALKIDYAKELNHEQFLAATAGDGPCLVLAGAGSGKTRTLVYRLLYLLENGVKATQIMLVTFTNKAAKEMLHRVAVLGRGAADGLWGGTFHSIGNRLLRMYGAAVDLKPNFAILDEEDAKSLLKNCLKSFSLPQDKLFPRAELIRKIISLSVNLARPITAVVRDRFSQISQEHVPLIVAIAESYRVQKLVHNALDYDDLLFFWLKLLAEKPEIKNRLVEKFRHVLVDEYQDTNYLQGEIVRHLAGDEKSALQNVFVVGDDSQSIYSFRGADVSNILNFPKIFPRCRMFKLETNYRSTPEILALANHSIDHNAKQFEKTLKTHKKSGLKPILASLQDGGEQADFVCARIDELQESGLRLKEIAVLFRAHFQSLELEMALNRRGIKYVMRGGLRFFEQAHVKDVMAYLKIINYFKDGIAWRRVLTLQPGIGEARADKIVAEISRFSSLENVLSDDFVGLIPIRSLSGWQAARRLIKRLATIDRTDIGAMVKAVITSGYDDFLKNNFENYRDRADDLDQLAAFAAAYDSLEKILADVALSEGFKNESRRSEENTAEDHLILSTIHQAKGLEWKAVFIIGLVDGQFPNGKVFERPQDLEEERRLFYVAATRAQDRLYLTYPLFSAKGGYLNQLSAFVRELPDGVYENWRSRERSKPKNVSDHEVIYEEEEGEVAQEFWRRIISKKK